MGALTAKRQEIVAAITSVKASDHVPGRITPPIALVVPSEPYLEKVGATFCNFTSRYDVVVIAPTSSNAKATRDLDDLVEDVVVDLANARYGIERVGAPTALEANNATYVAVTITLKTTVTI